MTNGGGIRAPIFDVFDGHSDLVDRETDPCGVVDLYVVVDNGNVGSAV